MHKPTHVILAIILALVGMPIIGDLWTDRLQLVEASELNRKLNDEIPPGKVFYHFGHVLTRLKPPGLWSPQIQRGPLGRRKKSLVR